MHKFKDNREEIEASPYLQRHVRSGEDFKSQVTHVVDTMTLDEILAVYKVVAPSNSFYGSVLRAAVNRMATSASLENRTADAVALIRAYRSMTF